MTHDDRYGQVCDRCGLSDVGYGRLMALGFDPHPCDLCRDHFNEADT